MRLLSISRSGRHVALATADGVEVVDALGTAPRRAFARNAADDFACVGSALWVVATQNPHDAAPIQRWSLETGKPLEPTVSLPFGGGTLRPIPGDLAGSALVVGARVALVKDNACEVLDGFPAASWPLTARRILRGDPDGVRVVELGRGEVARLKPFDGAPIGAWPMFGGRALAVLMRGADEDAFLVCRADGALIHRLDVPRTRHVAVADQRGTALAISEDGSLRAIDLRYGRTLNETTAPADVVALDLDADGLYVALATAVDGAAPHVLHLAITELLTGGRPQPKPEPAPAPTLRTVDRAPPPEQVDAAEREPDEAAADEAPAAPRSETEIPDLPPLAFGRPSPPLSATAAPGVEPYASPLDHFDDLLELVGALTGRAIALGWHSGRLSATADDPRPFQREVLALLGRSGELAADEVADADRRVMERTTQLAARARSSLAAGVRLPFVELARELSLTATAMQVLAVAIGPLVRGELARLYGILSNDESRGLCDVLLITEIVAAGDPKLRAAVLRELADDAPLVRFGLVFVGNDASRLFAPVTVDEVLIERLRGDAPSAGLGDVSTLRRADRAIEQLRAPRAVLRDVVLACAEPRDAASPLRLVLRGRRGSGRTTLIATLAARLGRPISVIDGERLPRGGRRAGAALRAELFRALLRGTVPVVSGLETVDADDGDARDVLRQVVRAHPGPVIVRASPEASIPIEPGYVNLALPPLSEHERVEVWREALAEVGLPCADVDTLAARYRAAPGTITSVVRTVAARRAHEGVADDVDAGPRLDDAARQHITTRLDRVASHVTRLAQWEQVALPDDVLDSLREFIGRIRHRRTVYESWGFDRKMSTSRGLTALFYGPPGTGKSMVAGLIARELGLELYKVDLSRVVSKWIGETEKNLAEVFDAAEDGQVVVLFDEADSLFAKRTTDVKTAVDRYANLEVNYLLQRLDSFEGIGILTTNLEGAIDPAFKRRMSLRLQFPFPDEEIRTRLWAAHVPPETPIAGDLDFADLAHRFPLSGGYIRNSAIRAAFLAAQEDRPLSHDHLVRAIQLEYRELGKLSSSGRME